MLKKPYYILFLFLLLFTYFPGYSQDSLVNKMIVKDQFPFKASQGQFVGQGWDTLAKAVQRSRFVLIGEEHGMDSIPMFTSAIARVLQPAVFVSEVDPYTATEMKRLVKEGGSHLEYFKKYPWSLSFYNLQPEFQLLKDLDQQKVDFWGIDQVMLLSSSRLFQMMTEAAKSPAVKKMLAVYTEKFLKHDLEICKSGDYSKLVIFTIPQSSIDSLDRLLVKENASCRNMWDAFKESRSIYVNNKSSHPQRVSLMKRTLMNKLYPYLKENGPAIPKLLFKMGAVHASGNESLLTIFDVGNLMSNLADIQKVKSLHIFVIAQTGTYNTFASTDDDKAIKPYLPEKNQTDFLKPYFDVSTDKNHWQLFDLRPLRRKIEAGKISISNMWLRRTVLGYDFLVVIPEVNGSKLLKE